MQENHDGPLVPPSSTQDDPDETDPLDLFQVAPPETNIPTPHIVIDAETDEEVKESAAMIGRRHDLDSQLEDLGLTDDTIESDYIEAGKRSLQEIKASKSTVQLSLNQVNLTYEASQHFVNLDGMLNQELLLNLRVKHDSQVGRKKGNERRKKQPPENNSPAPDVNEVPGKIDPRTCSKIVASIVKNAEGLEKVVARIHRWNMHVPLSMHRLKINAPSNITIPTQTLFNEGSVSKTNPLEPGKFVVVIKKKVCLYSPFCDCPLY